VKDQIAREAAQEAQRDIDLLAKRLNALTHAYDELFDFLAAEVGFCPKQVEDFPTFIPYPGSPRRLARTTPVSEVLRVPVKLKPKKAREGP